MEENIWEKETKVQMNNRKELNILQGYYMQVCTILYKYLSYYLNMNTIYVFIMM